MCVSVFWGWGVLNIFLVLMVFFRLFYFPFLGLIGFGLFYISLVSSFCLLDEQMKCFQVEVDVLTFQMSEVLLIFFRLKGFLTMYFWLCYRWMHYLSMLIEHSIVLSCFCSKDLFFRPFRFFSIASDAKLSFCVEFRCGFSDSGVFPHNN